MGGIIGGSKKKQPKPPTPVDPVALSNAQADANIRTAQEQQRLNMVGSSGPWGSSSWASDANAPGGYTQTTTLSPQLQSLFDQLQGRINTSGGYQTQANPNNQYSDALYSQLKSRLDPNWQQQESAFNTRLANQGLSPGSTAYNNAYGNFARARNDAYNDAAYRSVMGGYDVGFNEANLNNSAVNSQYGSLQGLLGLGQGTPYSPVGVSGTDVLGAYGLQAQQQNNAYNAQMQNFQAQQQATAEMARAMMMFI